MTWSSRKDGRKRATSSCVTFRSAGEGEEECLAPFTMTKLFFFFLKMGVGLLVVYRWSIAASCFGLQLGASCVNQPLLICFIHPSFSPSFFLPLFPSPP